MELDKTTVITGAQSAKPRVGVSQKQLLNLASSNYLGLCSSEQIRDKAIETLRNYGVGSCGPPGFYGTIDVHMDLEKNLAAFIGVEEAIIYAQAFSTISSVIPAFAKRGDMIVVYVSGRIIYLFILLSTPKPLLLFFFFFAVTYRICIFAFLLCPSDDGVNFAVQKGVLISRSNVRRFKHNDLDDLERVLEDIRFEDTVVCLISFIFAILSMLPDYSLSFSLENTK